MAAPGRRRRRPPPVADAAAPSGWRRGGRRHRCIENRVAPRGMPWVLRPRSTTRGRGSGRGGGIGGAAAAPPPDAGGELRRRRLGAEALLAAARQAKAPPAARRADRRCRRGAASQGAACRFLAAGRCEETLELSAGQTFAMVSILHTEENKKESDHSDAHKKTGSERRRAIRAAISCLAVFLSPDRNSIYRFLYKQI
jgi:hypothetical protein